MTLYNWMQITAIALLVIGFIGAIALKEPLLGMGISGGWLVAWVTLSIGKAFTP